MRVAHISKVTGIAGSEGHLLTLLPSLKTRGVEVHMLILFEPRQPQPAYLARWEALEIDAAALPIYHHVDLTVVGRLAQRLRRIEPDIVHTHLIHADLYGTPAARLAGARAVISTRHNDDAFRQHPLIRWQTRALDRLIDHYIAISGWLRDYTTDVEGVAPEKITTIHYGLSPAASQSAPNGLRTSLGVPDGAPLAGVVARLVEQKGHTYLFDAFQQVVGELPGAHLLVVGDGPLREKLEAQVAALGIGEQVHFTGWRDDAPHIMAALDVLVMPSLWEGFGLVALEAMAQAKPIVATRVSALPEVVVDEQTGWLVPPRDPGALADALLHALGHPDLARACGQRGYRRLNEHFSPDKLADQTLAVYERILAERSAA